MCTLTHQHVHAFFSIFFYFFMFSRTLEFLIVSGIILRTQARTDSGRLYYYKRRPGSLREPVLLSWEMYTSACAHFQLSMCMFTGEHTHMYTSACAHIQLSMCTHSGEHVYIYTSACVHFQLSMCMFPVEHAHVHFSMCTLSVEHVHACR